MSVNWLEFLGLSGRAEQISEVRRALQAGGLTIKVSGKIAVGNVGQMIEAVGNERGISVKHEPLAHDPSHSGIFNLGPDDDLIADLIAEVFTETYAGLEP